MRPGFYEVVRICDGMYRGLKCRRSPEYVTFCMDKMLSDGYFDMNIYIHGRIKKAEMYAKLVACKSKYAVLYRGAYPNQNNARSVWNSKVQKQEGIGTEQKLNLLMKRQAPSSIGYIDFSETLRKGSILPKNSFRE